MSESSSRGASPDPDAPVVFSVDDDQGVRDGLRRLISSVGLAVEVFATAQAFLAARRPDAPGCLVLDVRLPGLSGLDLQRELTGSDDALPIVFLTGYGDIPMSVRAMKAGAVEFLTKPFREQDLLPAIRTARARHEELVALREQADSLAEALASRKSIERAKGLLMEREGLTEQEAFARLRKASQVSGRPLKVVAEAVVATLEGPD